MPSKRRSTRNVRKQLEFHRLEPRQLLATLANGQEIVSSIGVESSESFEIEVTFGQRVNVSVGEIGNFGQPFLTVLAPGGMVLGTHTDSDDTATFTFNATQSGTYTAVVTDDGNDQSVSFRIRALTSPGAIELLPGRDQVLSSGEEATATVPVGGFNVFPFEATFGQRVNISVGEINNFGQPFLTVLGPDGTVVGTDTDSDDTADLTFNATQSGTYTAVVTDDGNDQSVSFRIRALTSPGTIQLIPGRDQALSSGDEATATVPVGGFNVFPFEAMSGQQVNVSVVEIGNFGQPFLTILGPGGTVLGTHTDSASMAAFSFNATESGAYTAVVTDDGNNQSFSFRITATGIIQRPPDVSRFERDGETDDRVGLLDRPDQLGVINVSFNQPVDVSASDFVFVNETADMTLNIPAHAFSYDEATLTAQFDVTSFLPALFSSGLYRISAPASAVTAISDGRPLVENFSQQVLVALPGDINLDGVVDVLGDAAALVNNLGLTQNALWIQGDVTGDGAVDVLGDAAILVQNLGGTVIPVASSVGVFALSPIASINLNASSDDGNFAGATLAKQPTMQLSGEQSLEISLAADFWDEVSDDEQGGDSVDEVFANEGFFPELA